MIRWIGILFCFDSDRDDIFFAFLLISMKRERNKIKRMKKESKQDCTVVQQASLFDTFAPSGVFYIIITPFFFLHFFFGFLRHRMSKSAPTSKTITEIGNQKPFSSCLFVQFNQLSTLSRRSEREREHFFLYFVDNFD